MDPIIAQSAEKLNEMLRTKTQRILMAAGGMQENLSPFAEQGTQPKPKVQIEHEPASAGIGTGSAIPISVTSTLNSLPDITGIKLNIRSELRKVGAIGATGIQQNLDWKDANLSNLAGIRISLIGEPELLVLCKDILKELSIGVSERTAGKIMLAAWNLRSIVTEKLVFPDVNPANNPGTVSLTSIPDNVIYTGGDEYIVPVGLVDKELISAVCFISASMLRMFTKTPENYVLAYKSHIKEAYAKFYKKQFPLGTFNPAQTCLSGIASMFSNISRYRNTLAGFLLSFATLPNDGGMCQMLFEQHVGLTGMHAVGLFTRACDALKANGEELGSGLWHKRTKHSVTTLLEVIDEYIVKADEPDSASRRLRTWKYARLYDTKYFSSLQTKNCKELVCVLAYLCIYAGVQGNQNILDIAHIKNMPPETKLRFQIWAGKIYALFDTGEEAAEGNMLAM